MLNSGEAIIARGTRLRRAFILGSLCVGSVVGEALLMDKSLTLGLAVLAPEIVAAPLALRRGVQEYQEFADPGGDHKFF